MFFWPGGENVLKIMGLARKQEVDIVSDSFRFRLLSRMLSCESDSERDAFPPFHHQQHPCSLFKDRSHYSISAANIYKGKDHI